MANAIIQWNGAPPCGVGSEPYVGETYILNLNTRLFSGTYTDPITATFVSEGPGGSNYDRTYTFTFADSLLPEGLTALATCHVCSIGCTQSCCNELRREVDTLRQDFDDAGILVSSEDLCCTGLTTLI
jgi:hypothetical protein